MSVSGRSSSCSIAQDELLQKEMCKTPKTPIKTSYQTTPRRSERKRSLFQSNSPAKSDDLGLMAPLSPSSSSSSQSVSSPQFSPNGKLSTPNRTPVNSDCGTPRVASKKIEIKSSLFPDLKVFTPKSKRTPRTPRTLAPKVSTPENRIITRSQTTPSRKPSRRELFTDIVAESDSPSSMFSVSLDSHEDIANNDVPDCPTILGIKPLSCESFYGPACKSDRVRTKLFIDTLERHSSGLNRSLSKESLASNKSFVKGGTQKRPVTKRGEKSQPPHAKSGVRRKSIRGRTKGLQQGVWHNIKKPKQIKKIQKPEKPLISPQYRLEKINQSANQPIKVKEKSSFQENPRKRVSFYKKRNRNDIEENDDYDDDMFGFTKKKKLPSQQLKLHPAITSPEILTPDPNKKFLKYSHSRKATFTLNESLKLNISNGVIKLQTPKKRRKLYSGKRDWIEDFNDVDDGDNDIQSSIQGILNILEDDRPIPKGETDISQNLMKISPSKKNGRSPLKSVSNLPSLIINDFESEDEEKSQLIKAAESDKESSEVSLHRTGNIVSYMTNILVNEDQDVNVSLSQYFSENDEEYSSSNKDKLFSLFYKENWNKGAENNENGFVKASATKKKFFVPDDQYLLDAGQESVGIVTCKKCGVMYQAGDFADEATHNSFHNHLPELKFTGWNNERVVGRYADGRVIMILSTDPKIWWQKVSKIVDIVDQELGFPEASVHSLFYKTVYLYIHEKSKQIAGCLIAEECKEAYKMFPPLEGVEIDSCSKDPSPCRVGVSRIWTALSHRRRGVASRMVECLQKSFFFGDIVSMDQIAFSVPSPSGKLFAQKVTGKLDFLVYGFA